MSCNPLWPSFILSRFGRNECPRLGAPIRTFLKGAPLPSLRRLVCSTVESICYSGKSTSIYNYLFKTHDKKHLHDNRGHFALPRELLKTKELPSGPSAMCRGPSSKCLQSFSPSVCNAKSKDLVPFFQCSCDFRQRSWVVRPSDSNSWLICQHVYANDQ